MFQGRRHTLFLWWLLSSKLPLEINQSKVSFSLKPPLLLFQPPPRLPSPTFPYLFLPTLPAPYRSPLPHFAAPAHPLRHPHPTPHPHPHPRARCWASSCTATPPSRAPGSPSRPCSWRGSRPTTARAPCTWPAPRGRNLRGKRGENGGGGSWAPEARAISNVQQMLFFLTNNLQFGWKLANSTLFGPNSR